MNQGPINPWDNPTPQKPTAVPPRPQFGGGNGGGNGGGRRPPGQPPLPDPMQLWAKLKELWAAADTRRQITFGGVALLVLWAATGIFRVLPEEHAVILRFGQYTQTVADAGLHYHLPWPIERAQKLNVTFERRIEVGYRTAGGFMGAMPQNANRNDVPEESLMLTGDANIVDIDFVVQWKIANARDFLFNVRNQEDTIKKTAESALREVVGQNNLQSIITEGREDVAARTKKSMQTMLDGYKSGVMVTQVLIQDASVPGPVIDAFEDVIRATQQAETMRNQALRFKNEVVPQAQGEAAKITREAEAYESQVVTKAQGEAARFNNVYQAYAQSPQVTRERLYVDTLQQVLANSNTMIIDGAAGKAGAVPFLSLNELQKQAAKNATTKTEGR